MKELQWRDIIVRITLIIVTVGIVVWAMPHDSRTYFHAEQGKPWKYADFAAPYDFAVYKSETTIQEERDSAMQLYELLYELLAH